MAFPNTRPRRTRQSDPWRRLVRETHLRPEGLVYPLFVVPGRAVRQRGREHARHLPALRR